MPDWIAKANIELFSKLLETETDLRKRAVIKRELAEEEAKLASIKVQQDQQRRGKGAEQGIVPSRTPQVHH